MQWHGGIEMSGAQSGVKLPMAATMATRDEHFCRETGKLTFIRESFPALHNDQEIPNHLSKASPQATKPNVFLRSSPIDEDAPVLCMDNIASVQR
jgi:hypothetical protein